MRATMTAGLLALFVLGAYLAPRLSAPTGDAAGPCVRWGPMECCYANDPEHARADDLDESDDVLDDGPGWSRR